MSEWIILTRLSNGTTRMTHIPSAATPATARDITLYDLSQRDLDLITEIRVIDVEQMPVIPSIQRAPDPLA